MTDGTKRGSKELLSDEELRRRIMARPEVQARLNEVLAEMQDPAWKTRKTLTTEELVEFLREHG
jgi:hypothetical protein